MMEKMQGKRKLGRQQMGWIEEVQSSMQMNLVELCKTYGEP
jgi:hypothetical protein